MIRPSQSSHWYTESGDPAYNATLRDARKQKLYPSVTQVIGIIEKPAIASWMVNLMSEACYENPPRETEAIDEYRARVEPIFQSSRSVAADRGSAIHDFAENYIRYGDTRTVPFYEEQCRLLADWIESNIHSAHVEQSFAHKLGGYGYGGRVDAYGVLTNGKPFLLDFKTQGCKNGKPVYYPEWRWQLAAYRAAVRQGVTCLSVVIDTTEPAIYDKEYTGLEMDESEVIFSSILKTWYLIKGL